MERSVTIQQGRRTTQACDACKLRKVKCNGNTRCQQCSHLNLKCVYSTPKPRRKSLKRGQLIAQYKQSTSKGHQGPVTVPQVSTNPGPDPRNQTLPAITSLLSESPPDAAFSPSSQSPEDVAFFAGFIDRYVEFVYPVNPIITVAEILASIDEMHINKQARAFVYAFVAITITLTGNGPDAPSDTSSQVAFWAAEAMKLSGPMMPDDKVTIRGIMTAGFIHVCLMDLGNTSVAFFYLRQEISMIQMLRIDDPETLKPLSHSERARRQRLYWEAFVHERYLAIRDYRPVVLAPLTYLPEYDITIPKSIHEGFAQIIKLFALIDENFLRNWLGGSNSTEDRALSLAWIEKKNRELDSELAGTAIELSHLSDMQQADLIVTKSWMQTLVWQMAMSKCLLSSAASSDSLSLHFPVRLSVSLRSMVSKMSRVSIEIHGSGIQHKLFELTDTIANVIITVPATNVEETAGRVDDFMFLTGFLFSLSRFNSVQRNILQKKLETLQSMFPYSANTPDSLTFQTGATPEGSAQDEDNWSSTLETIPEQGSTARSPKRTRRSSQIHVTFAKNTPTSRVNARMWRDMARKLSLAPQYTSPSYEYEPEFEAQ